MPFPNQDPKPFDKTYAILNKTDDIGVYGIYRKDQWIYIGKGVIWQRILDHINGDIPCILNMNPTNWVYEFTVNMDQREKDLIQEFNPPCNKKIG